MGQDTSSPRSGALRRAAETVDARTPEDRDRYADLVRVVAILVVVLGHWIVTVVQMEDGEPVATQLLVVEPWTRLATWLVQVMPLFFLVGGKVNAGSLARAREQGQTSPEWVRKRARRLLRPVVPLLVLWLAGAPLLAWLGVDDRLVAEATEAALLPLWFLIVYLLVIILAPATMWLHRRAGGAVLVVGIVLVVVVDVLLRREMPVVGEANHLLVFGLAHQLGYFWADGRLPSGWRALHLTLAGLGTAALLVVFLDYPTSMVGVMNDVDSNATPPTLALLALTFAQLGLVLGLCGPADRWLHRRPVPWAGVVAVGSVIITLFVWHMTALVAVASLTHVTGWWPHDGTVEPTWWALRPVWLLLCVVLLVPLVLLFRKLEGGAEPPPGGLVSTVVGVVCTGAGLYVLLTESAWDPDRALGLPLAAVVILAAGLVLLGIHRSGEVGTEGH
jgi:fucose 4-O-acetylase-like acetyltransferase